MDDKTEYILEEIDEVKDVMFQNVQKLNLNVVNLEDLDSKAENTKKLSETMMQQSKTLKNKEWWLRLKVQIVLVLILSFVFGIIILAAVMSTKN